MKVAPYKTLRSSFAALVERLGDSMVTLSEDELFCAEDLFGNDVLHRELHAQRRGGADLNSSLDVLEELIDHRYVFCPGDPRFVLEGDDVETLGVVRTMRTGKIDVPNIYRLGFGLRRRGGVPSRERRA